jgi:hypothetical protein
MPKKQTAKTTEFDPVVEGHLTDLANHTDMFTGVAEGRYVMTFKDDKIRVTQTLSVFWDGKTLTL